MQSKLDATLVAPAPRTSLYRWYVVLILTLSYVLSLVDRQIVAFLVQPLKRSLHLSDAQMGLILGPAFAILYITLGLPLGWLADRVSRRSLVAVGILLWSVTTAACGLARRFSELFLARIGVGVGEATLGPCALSLIADYFEPRRRGRAVAFYTTGICVGTGIAYLAGGAVVALADRGGVVVFPGLGEVAPWQRVFMLVSLPGLVVAALMWLTVREPPRRAFDSPEVGGRAAASSVGAALAHLREQWRAYGAAFATMAGVTITGYSLTWLPTLFQRQWGWSVSTFGYVYGLANLVGGPLGAAAGGFWADGLIQRGRADGALVAAMGAFALSATAAVVSPLLPAPEFAIAGYAFSTICGSAANATSATAVLLIANPHMRGQIVAVYLMLINLAGLSLGPTSVGWLTDYIFGSDAAIRWSMSLTVAFFGLIVLVLAALGRSSYRAAARSAISA